MKMMAMSIFIAGAYLGPSFGCRAAQLAETLWLRSNLRKQVGSAARLIEKGVVCWLHRNRGLLLEKPIRMFGEGHEVPIRQTK